MKDNSRVNYTSCIRLRCLKDKTLSKVRRYVFDWLKNKEPDDFKAEHYEDFKRRLDLKLTTTKAKVMTDHCHNHDTILWSMRYEHRDSEYKGKRFWYVDVGIKVEDDELILSTITSFGYNQNDVSAELPTPTATVPNFIRRIMADESLGEKYIINKGNVLRPTPIVIESSKKASAIAGLITKSDRMYCWVIINGSDHECNENARFFSDELNGKCQVIQIKGTDAENEFAYQLPDALKVWPGHVRIFFPPSNGHLPSERQRWFNIKDEGFDSARRTIVNGLLRNLPAYDRAAIKTISDVRNATRLLQVSRQTEQLFKSLTKEETSKFEPLIKKAEELQELLALAETERDEQRITANQFAELYDLKETEVGELKLKINHLEPLARAVQIKAYAANALESQFGMPENLAELVVLFEKLYGDKVIFTKEAHNEARKYAEFNALPIAWKMLSSLAFTLRNMRFVEKDGMHGEWNKRFELLTGFELAISEGKQTKADPSLMRLRRIVHEGTEYNIEPHIKYGSREPKIMRIYYDFEPATRRVLIGYIGPHMKNYSTQYVD